MTDTTQIEKKKKLTGADHARESLAEITSRMRSWAELTRDIRGKMPPMLIAALAANRPELVLAIRAEKMEPDETAALLQVVAALLETNSALQHHASEIAKRTMHIEEQMRGLVSAMRRVDHFANFRNPDDHYED